MDYRLLQGKRYWRRHVSFNQIHTCGQIYLHEKIQEHSHVVINLNSFCQRCSQFSHFFFVVKNDGPVREDFYQRTDDRGITDHGFALIWQNSYR
ncbi:hypothetical protein A6U95_18280 [Serratia sp. 14-2641]|nr:hypothetical protein A6U95_18280 [Serratia sp. 14-2641]